MKSIKTLTLLIACAGFMTITTGFSQTKMVGGAPMYPSKDIVSNAVNSKDHTTLVAAVKAAGLVETLQGEGPFTVFAPTNSAFEKLPDGTVATLLKPENKAKLQGVLTYHVVAGKYNAKDLKKWILHRFLHRSYFYFLCYLKKQKNTDVQSSEIVFYLIFLALLNFL